MISTLQVFLLNSVGFFHFSRAYYTTLLDHAPLYDNPSNISKKVPTYYKAPHFVISCFSYCHFDPNIPLRGVFKTLNLCPSRSVTHTAMAAFWTVMYTVPWIFINATDKKWNWKYASIPPTQVQTLFLCFNMIVPATRQIFRVVSCYQDLPPRSCTHLFPRHSCILYSSFDIIKICRVFPLSSVVNFAGRVLSRAKFCSISATICSTCL